jgi:hypothetical protein
MPSYSLKSILLSFANANGKRRLIFNLGAIGGISANVVLIFFISLPFIEYALLFNPYVFSALGIAQCIVLYIVFLSIIMIVIFLTTWVIKIRVIKKITPSWEKYFAHINLNMLLSSGLTPYSQFFDYYAQGLKENISEESLHNYLLSAFKTMEEENKDLLDAMKRDNKLH